jgi:hypothetical protein
VAVALTQCSPRAGASGGARSRRRRRGGGEKGRGTDETATGGGVGWGDAHTRQCRADWIGVLPPCLRGAGV